MRLTVAQAVVRYLAAQFSVADARRQRLVPGMLAIFGHGNTAGFGEALASAPGSMFFLEGRNEQAMAHAAAAFARANRRRSTLACSASIGPGSLNMVTAAAGAHVNRLPVLLLPTDMYATRRQGPHLQGLEHPLQADWSVNDAFRPVSRYFDRISRPEQLLQSLPAAMLALTDAQNVGPVVLSLPQDLQAEAFEFPVSFFDERDWHIERPAPDAGQVERAAAVIRDADRPVIIAGGGVRYAEAEDALRSFAERHGVPVAETFAGKGSFSDKSWRDLGGLGVEGATPANVVVGEADVVICAGTRLQDFLTGSRSIFAAHARLVGLNVSRSDAAKQGGVPVVGDLRPALAALDQALGGHVADHAVEERAASLRDEWQQAVASFTADDGRQPFSQAEAISVLNAEVRCGDSVTSAAGTAIGELLKFWDGSEDRRADLEMGFSCMGYEIPAAIGRKLANPDAESFAFVGDGTFLLYPSDLVVAAQHGIKITVVISDNGGMQSIHRLERGVVPEPYANLFQHRDPETRALKGTPLPLDLGAVARGMGAHVLHADDQRSLRVALEAARDVEGPVAIVCRTDASRSLARGEVWWDIPPAEVSSSDAVSAARASYEDVRAARQPAAPWPEDAA